MALLSIPPVFLQFKTYAEFTRNVYWTRSDKAASVASFVVGIIPLHFNGSQKITSLRVTGRNPGGTCYIGIWEHNVSNGQWNKPIVQQFPSGNPFDVTAVPAGGYYVTNPTDHHYDLAAYAIGPGIEINVYNIKVEATPIG
ncbi:MAG: hypothetical protein IH944_02780 [Armatimonadetes bacterium]|nr:hypothetical protein [Armatimonadota bacterium]